MKQSSCRVRGTGDKYSFRLPAGIWRPDVDYLMIDSQRGATGPLFTPLESDLIGLAPIVLPNFWRGRFTAENERRRLQDFTSRDQTLLLHVYGTLQCFFETIEGHHLDLERLRIEIRIFIEGGHVLDLLNAMREFGASTIELGTRPGIERTIHDLKGGAFQALSFRLEFFSVQADKPGWQSVYFLVRDHLKIMRNNVCDLDIARFTADHAKLDHDARLLIEKWSQAEFFTADHPVSVELKCTYNGTLCESCLEFSTLDRIIYNLMNNAAKYSSDGVVDFYILPVPAPTPTSVRFVFCNSIDDMHRSNLQQKFGEHLSDLFHGGFTTGGHGLGMRICGDFCAQAYGINDFDRAREGGYFGASWLNQKFATWFHWPIAHGIA